MSGDVEHENAKLRATVRRLQAELDRVRQERIEYLQNVAHQLVAPLHAIKGHIENLTAGRIGVERAKKVLRSVYSQATVAVHLAKNFALMSNLEADHALSGLREPLEPVCLVALLVNLSDDFQPLGWDRELHIGVDEESFERIPDVLAMKPLISQVFSNIIENAIKYSDNNTRVLIAGEYDEAQGMAIVRISNKGIGIGHGEGDRIFERGVRGDKAKVRYPAGTGFGLFIARKIIEIHRGSVWAYMAPDNRTVFEVKLTVRGLEGLTKQWPAKRS